MRRHFEAFRHVFQDNFEGFLRYVIDYSNYDRYIFDGEIEVFE